jgi:hypothetical protein
MWSRAEGVSVRERLATSWVWAMKRWGMRVEWCLDARDEVSIGE